MRSLYSVRNTPTNPPWNGITARPGLRSQPEISVTQIQGTPGNPLSTDLFLQFTSVAEPSSGTGDDALEVTNWVPGADNPAPVDAGGDHPNQD